MTVFINSRSYLITRTIVPHNSLLENRRGGRGVWGSTVTWHQGVCCKVCWSFMRGLGGAGRGGAGRGADQNATDNYSTTQYKRDPYAQMCPTYSCYTSSFINFVNDKSHWNNIPLIYNSKGLQGFRLTIYIDNPLRLTENYLPFVLMLKAQLYQRKSIK